MFQQTRKKVLSSSPVAKKSNPRKIAQLPNLMKADPQSKVIARPSTQGSLIKSGIAQSVKKKLVESVGEKSPKKRFLVREEARVIPRPQETP